MFEFTRNFYFLPEEGGSESSFTPGQIIIPEQTVTVSTSYADYELGGIISGTEPPEKLLIEFDGTGYIVEKATASNGFAYYGEYVDNNPSFNTYPFCIVIEDVVQWYLGARSNGTHTISAKIPEEKSSKVLSFPKGRTIVSELSRLNKAFGTISTKKTIIGQLSDIADAAEAGKIGGGSSKEYWFMEFVFSNSSQVTINPGETATLELACNNEDFLNYPYDIIISDVRYALPNYIIVGFPYYNRSTKQLFVNIYNKSSEAGYSFGQSTFSICAFGLVGFESE